ADGTPFRWVYGKEDQGLNAAMLARLMVSLGTDVGTASARVTEAEKVETRPSVQALPDRTALALAENFDRAWRRVGVAIDSAGFSVEDRDRSSGDYFIRYLDVDLGQKIEQPNIFTRMFGGKNTAEPVPHRIHVQEQGGTPLVQVLDATGVVQEDDTAKRILSVLADHMRSNCSVGPSGPRPQAPRKTGRSIQEPAGFFWGCAAVSLPGSVPSLRRPTRARRLLPFS